MTTYDFKINLSDKDNEIILEKQKQVSRLFRILFKNIKWLTNKEKLSELRYKFEVSAKHIEYITKEVISFIKKEETRKKNILKLIKKLEKLKQTKKVIFKIKQKKQELLNKPVFGGKKHLKQISKLSNIQNRTIEQENSLQNHRKIYKEFRLRYLMFQGETNYFGNRNINLSGLSNGSVKLKFEKTDITISIKILNISKKRLEDFKIIDYNPLSKIIVPVAV